MPDSGKSAFSTRRIVMDAVLIALFVAVDSLSIRLGNTFKITFDSIAVLLAAMAYGPVDALIVGLLGEFLYQVLFSGYGFTPTTVLWLLGPALRGLLLGLAVVIFKEKMSLKAIVSEKKPYIYFIAIIIAAFVTSTCNTLALLVDSKLYGYYSYAMVWGAYLARIGTGVLSSVISGIIAVPILQGLKKAKLVSKC